MKKKLFYRQMFVFFLGALCVVMPQLCCAASFSPEDQKRMDAIKKHNREQQKNMITIEKYTQKNEMKPQSDDYWNLAWDARAADTGDAKSQFVVAKAYETGRYTDPNPQKAVSFYEKACDQKHAEACMRLGEIYSENKWVKADEEKALYWFVKSAEADYTPAQFKISYIYEENADFVAARDWREKALKTLFPESKDVAEQSPGLAELRVLADKQAQLRKRGVNHLFWHESVFLEPRTIKGRR